MSSRIPTKLDKDEVAILSNAHHTFLTCPSRIEIGVDVVTGISELVVCAND